MGHEKQRVLKWLSERDHREEELGRTSTNCSFVWGTGPVGKGILRVHVWRLLILSPSLYMMIFFCWFHHCCYYHYLALSPHHCRHGAKQLNWGSRWAWELLCSLLAHTCQWQCHCWWPRCHKRHHHRSSAAATAQEPCSQLWAARSPAPATRSSYMCHSIQEPGMPSGHIMFCSSCIQQHLRMWNSLVAKSFPSPHWIIFSDIMCRITKPSLLKVFPLWTNREGARCSSWGQKGHGWGFFWGPTSASRASHNTLSSILFSTQQMQSHWLSTE